MFHITNHVVKSIAICSLCIIVGIIAGCSSYRINVNLEPSKQAVNKPANIKFCITSVEFISMAEDESDNKYPNYDVDAAKNNAMLLEELNDTAVKLYPDVFLKSKDSIGIKIRLTRKRGDNDFFWPSCLALGILPVHEQSTIEYSIEVFSNDNNINQQLSIPVFFEREETRWMSLFSPLGWIPVPGGSGERTSGNYSNKKTKEKMDGACIEATTVALRRVEPVAWQNSNCKTIAQQETYETQEKLKGNIPYIIGDRGPAGGWIFYDKGNNNNGWRYLEAAPEDLSDATPWSEGNPSSISSTGVSIGSGTTNTASIIRKQGNGNYAASICANYRSGGKKDWFLPSQEELDLMYRNLKTSGMGNFSDGRYWSSSETNDLFAKSQNFVNGFMGNVYKNNVRKVRAIRAFYVKK